jgi:DNA-binding HxlR family transcriptional regulator
MSLNGTPGVAPRAGSRVLGLFGSPLNAAIFRSLEPGPLSLEELREVLGGPARTTLSERLAHLLELGAVERRERSPMPYATEYAATALGRDLLLVARLLELWLASAPSGPTALETERGKRTIRALVGGWDSTLLMALAATPLPLTRLDGLIAGLTYPALERRLSALRTTGQVEPLPSPGRATPYGVTEWTRRAIAPLCMAGRCERVHLPDTTPPIARLDVEALFLLAAPLAKLPPVDEGRCQLAVKAGGDGQKRVGVEVTLERGAAVSCVTRLDPQPPSWAMGSAQTWLDAVAEDKPDLLDTGGAQPELAIRLVSSLRRGQLSGLPSLSPALT